MAKKLRIDKILSNLGYGSRAELKVYCKKGMVKVNDKVISNPGTQVDTDVDKIEFNNEVVNYREFVEIIQNNYMVMPTYTNERLRKQSGVFC